jgi:hypothetical protein
MEIKRSQFGIPYLEIPTILSKGQGNFSFQNGNSHSEVTNLIFEGNLYTQEPPKKAILTMPHKLAVCEIIWDNLTFQVTRVISYITVESSIQELPSLFRPEEWWAMNISFPYAVSGIPKLTENIFLNLTDVVYMISVTNTDWFVGYRKKEK